MIPRPRSTLAVLVASFVQFALPALLMVILGGFRAVAVANIAMWRGVPPVMDDMAELWTQEALRLGWPSVWGNQIKNFFWWVALVVFVIGYILSAYITVWIIHLIFR